MVGGLEGKASAVSRMHFPKVTLIVQAVLTAGTTTRLAVRVRDRNKEHRP